MGWGGGANNASAALVRTGQEYPVDVARSGHERVLDGIAPAMRSRSLRRQVDADGENLREFERQVGWWDGRMFT